ncbi:hypothetical protein [Streptomyces sp. NBRC 109706]|uniref:hypothetical protein n=1 Tax=Streptomyces sp. NBRC 109706 TaxID=1550035 RepID=UPI0007852D0C|nr:hypothetical protein [Streptomyces sp. NBRC 109706]
MRGRDATTAPEGGSDGGARFRESRPQRLALRPAPDRRLAGGGAVAFPEIAERFPEPRPEPGE